MANLQKIKELSKEKNIPIKSIAAKVGVSEQGLHKMIREKTMSVRVLETIANILNVSIVAFFDSEITLGNKEEYTNYGERGFTVKNIENVDQRSGSNNGDGMDLQLKIAELQKVLLEAKKEIINLLKKKK